MLSFVYRLVRSFEQEHGVPPNLLYLSPTHLHSLKEQLDACEQMDDIVNLLGMEIVVTDETMHPHVAWTSTQWRRKAV